MKKKKKDQPKTWWRAFFKALFVTLTTLLANPKSRAAVIKVLVAAFPILLPIFGPKPPPPPPPPPPMTLQWSRWCEEMRQLAEIANDMRQYQCPFVSETEAIFWEMHSQLPPGAESWYTTRDLEEKIKPHAIAPNTQSQELTPQATLGHIAVLITLFDSNFPGSKPRKELAEVFDTMEKFYERQINEKESSKMYKLVHPA